MSSRNVHQSSELGRSGKEGVLPVRSALKRIRAFHDITQGKMCEILGYQHTYLSKIENGKSPLTLDFVTRVASCFSGSDTEIWKLTEFLVEYERLTMQAAVRSAISERASVGPPSTKEEES